MSHTQTCRKEWKGHEKQPHQKDREVYETQSNLKAIEWVQAQHYQKQWKDHENKEENRQKAKNGEPMIVINHLNYTDYDIQTMVDQVLTKNEFSDDSSIFVVVPSLDNDAGKSSDGQSSIICIQMSPVSVQWKTKVNPVELDSKQCRSAAPAHLGVKISAKGNKFNIGAIPIQILSFHNKETLSKYGHLMPKDNGRKPTENKLCQINTPKGMVERIERNVVSTDTTADRPCCCKPNPTQYVECSPNDRYVATVMSRLVTPLLERGMISNPFHMGWGMKQQESVMSVRVPLLPGSDQPCRLHHQACAPQTHAVNPANPTQYPTKAPEQNPANSAQHHTKPFKLIDEACSPQKKASLSQMQSCQCNPETILELLKLALKKNNIQHQSIGCERCLKLPKLQAPEPPPAAQSTEPEHHELCEMKPTLTDSVCPCGPAQETMQIEMGETKQKQVRIKKTKFSSTVGTSIEPKLFRSCKNGKKSYKNCKCECPQCEPGPEPEPEQNLEPHLILGPCYKKNELKDNIKKNSLEAVRVSGFKIIQKKRSPEIEPEYTIEDALRYYAMMNPELFKSIMAEQQAKMDNTKWTPPSSPTNNSDLETTPSDSQDEESQFMGLKLKIGGKGSGSQGLAGICCFDLLQESFTTW